MRVEELIIEGFKSYAVRTHITGWDAAFNAITGLNGSGKSNILDAICFVLGIKNLSAVRANNLIELVYKRGQAGVTKASVTIVFNNQDRDTSPIGYENCQQISVTRQILLGGRTKYLINGHTAQQHAVESLFQSVQLNVNNPHFLIMQGRITKVLNMKPVEVLAMIEEAAGTRMFEERKEKALSTITKKDKKVSEITAILNEEITPKLDRLREEKRAYLEFQKTEIEMDRLLRLTVAYQYVKCQRQLSQSNQEFEEKKERLKDIRVEMERLRTETDHLASEIEQLTQKRAKEIAEGGKIRELEDTVKNVSMQLVKAKTQCDIKSRTLKEEERQREQQMKNLAEIEAMLRAKQHQLDERVQSFESLRVEHETRAEQVGKSEELLQTLTTGLSAQEGQENGYMGQLQDVKRQIVECDTEVEQGRIRKMHREREIADLEPKAQRAAKENTHLQADVEAAKRKVGELDTKLRTLAYDPEREKALLTRRSELQLAIERLHEGIDQMTSQLSAINFTYSDPVPNFDRSKVKGVVAELVRLPSENAGSATALEVCAGGRLYNVVVENEQVGSQLLKHGRLQKTITIIPLNKIQPYVAAADASMACIRVKSAQRLAPGKVDLALNVVAYDAAIKRAMEYVFGSVLICEDAETAQKVTFDRAVRLKSITIEGDVYDPAGTLQGGSKPQSAGILLKVQDVLQARHKLDSLRQELSEVERALADMASSGNVYKQLSQQRELMIHQQELAQEQLASSPQAQIVNALQQAREQLASELVNIGAAQSRRQEAEQRCAHLEHEMSEFKENRDGKLAEMAIKLADEKAQLSKTSTVVKQHQREIHTLELELEQLGTDVESATSDVKASEASVAQCAHETEELQQSLVALKRSLDENKAALKAEQELLSVFDEEIQEVEVLHKEKSSQLTELQLELQRLTHHVERFQAERSKSEHEARSLERQHPWILEQRDQFDQPDTQFDFSTLDPKKSRERLSQLEAKFDSLRKKINAKVMNTLDSTEKRETALKNMIHTVMRDKRKIEDTIRELDQYKKEALEKTWVQVNRDFGEIFGELLDGNTCKLEPPEGKDLTDGLEVKVCLGGIWKNSLTELSGGQRSLVALALILSLLQYKPAPMYILDEIDAALDLSHTQNIGHLFRTRFKGSQFIVVSLKEGMFNNANVLFRARFRDGVSVVERIPQRFDRHRVQNDSSNRGSSHS